MAFEKRRLKLKLEVGEGLKANDLEGAPFYKLLGPILHSKIVGVVAKIDTVRKAL